MKTNQVKRKVGQIREMILDLLADVEETRDNIEPYEDKDDLTDQQQERYDWLDDCVTALQDSLDTLSDYED